VLVGGSTRVEHLGLRGRGQHALEVSIEVARGRDLDPRTLSVRPPDDVIASTISLENPGGRVDHALMGPRGLSGLVALVAGCAQAGAPIEPASGRDAGDDPDAPIREIPGRVDAAPPCVPVAAERLTNPVFDLTPVGTGWVDGRDPRVANLPDGPFAIISPRPTGVPTPSAPNKAWLGNFTGDAFFPAQATLTDQLTQDVVIPADATNVVVSGQLWIASADDPSRVFDTFRVDILELDGTPIETVVTASNRDAAAQPAYKPFSKTLTSNLAGKKIRVRLIAVNDVSDITNFIVDSMSLKATACL
jgi:hypothetical protein